MIAKCLCPTIAVKTFCAVPISEAMQSISESFQELVVVAGLVLSLLMFLHI